jgi:hypothetical protein
VGYGLSAAECLLKRRILVEPQRVRTIHPAQFGVFVRVRFCVPSIRSAKPHLMVWFVGSWQFQLNQIQATASNVPRSA